MSYAAPFDFTRPATSVPATGPAVASPTASPAAFSAASPADRLANAAANPAAIAGDVSETDGLARRALFGLQVVDADAESVIARLLDAVETGTPPQRVAFLNAHCGNVMARDPAYAAALQGADMVLPDGIGVELAARMRGGGFTENLNGTDFVPRLLDEAGRRGMSVYLFGGAPGVAEDAALALLRRASGLRIAGVRDGFAGAADPQAAQEAIAASGADILLVAMGVPRQDLWLANAADTDTGMGPGLSLGVGALFDFLAGRVRRAPAAVRRARMEWAWRLAMEPRRMAGRYLVGNATFLARAAAHALSCAFPRADVAKRALDLAVILPALLLLGPLFLAIAAAIRLDSRGPVLFRQVRVGRDGRLFEVLKFRSMHVDAEARRAALLATSDRAGVCFKSKADPRVTRVGRLLRRYSLDELPQLLNIARGEMSVVGPRPALPEEVAAYPDRALARLAVKPGLTGLWQVSGRADIGFDKMIDMDVAYTASRSVMLDVMLIAMTFRAVLTGRGAY
ncbi:WecB/TagA/CpsF family glycosyltransferase [Mesobaculum littorinae]|uniref:WecB/TagA/CpsF family glycosyltransferase n=1 Tax=Mesobaculum littorinae TaxID=2486419 RepID=A0A438ACZ7_9RHOB|nr:WecB/TagA/CpsF family glycosyltransferase [Mesobaculum littorinae]RVV96566.1 WecB/TagA/CpsF family glycosyltransferase [Mesobaculum littorinae]